MRNQFTDEDRKEFRQLLVLIPLMVVVMVTLFTFLASIMDRAPV